MTDKKMLLAIFPDVNPAAVGIKTLRELGIQDDHVDVISGLPITEAMMGRKKHPSHVPTIAFGGAVVGFVLGGLLAFWTPISYPINVGGQPIISGPPSVVVLFELTMLGMLLSTFVGVFLDSKFPNYEPKEYVTEVSDGKIALLIDCLGDEEEKIISALTKVGAESVRQAEAHQL
jgi:hypothetical protein